MQRIEKTIAEFLTDRFVPTVAPHATVEEVVDAMKSRQADCVAVVEDDALVGIFTERDFLNRVVGERRLPAETPVHEVMTPEPERLQRNHPVSYAIQQMAAFGFRNVPIVDDGKPLAILTIRDVIQHLSELLEEAQSRKLVDDEEWTDIGGG